VKSGKAVGWATYGRMQRSDALLDSF
jgi:hypothetical protein